MKNHKTQFTLAENVRMAKDLVTLVGHQVKLINELNERIKKQDRALKRCRELIRGFMK